MYFSICVLHGYVFSWNHLSYKNHVNKVMRENGKHDVLGKNLAIQFFRKCIEFIVMSVSTAFFLMLRWCFSRQDWELLVLLGFVIEQGRHELGERLPMLLLLSQGSFINTWKLGGFLVCLFCWVFCVVFGCLGFF